MSRPKERVQLLGGPCDGAEVLTSSSSRCVPILLGRHFVKGITKDGPAMFAADRAAIYWKTESRNTAVFERISENF